ncbi:hypothetical protein [Neolewinella sp.]|uniref:hypothetical protein n=1 Tax=Neolewinella sp. TaxID=2993543 RepID=UPI003B518CA2
MKTLLTGSCLFLSVLLYAQTFPDDWYGSWRGDLAIWRAGQQVDTVPMEFELSLADTGGINYIIRYLPEGRPVDERSYLLQSVDSTAGHYVIDERNGILLDEYLVDNCLYSRFDVMGSDLLARICYTAQDTLEYEITGGPVGPIRESGATTVGSDTIPPVRAYRIGSVTKAKLYREE